MRIAVLYNAMSARTGGGLTYATNQVRALAEHADLDLHVLTSPWNHEAFAAPPESAANVTVERVDVANAAFRFGWEQVALPNRARRHDLLVSPANFGPLWCPTPHVVIQQNPNYVGAGRRLAQNRGIRRRLKIAMSWWSMRRADVVVSISKSMEDELRSESALRTVRTVVVRSGAPSIERRPEALTPEIDRLLGGGSFVLSVANDYAHKRLPDLGRLARRLSDEPDGPRWVVLAGDIGEQRRAEIRAEAGPAADRVLFLGSIGDGAVIRGLYQRAVAAVSTSELESWGLTLHEAGAESCPVIATDLAVHRELADGRATFFPVGDVDALADAVLRAASAPRPEPWTMDRTWADHGRELATVLRSLVQSND